MVYRKEESYPYKVLQEGESLYDDELLALRAPVTAAYQQALSPPDVGNPFIEALPYPLLSVNQIMAAYNQPLLEYNGVEERKLSSELRMLHLTQLRQLRLPLPFQQELELQFYNALCLSYRARSRFYSDEAISCDTGEKKDLSPLHNRLQGNLADAANAGIALLGYSGCGKSSTLKILLRKYPQVINHYFNGGRMPQIVYLVVSCLPNSNFAALYAGIGQAIDSALGLPYVFEKEIAKKRTLGDKLRKVSELVALFAIGMIIFDEIQLIDFSSTKENSFESLLVLTNETKVAIAAIGTEDAYSKMFTSLRTARRIGAVISGSVYCSNRKYCELLIRELFKYQWFDERIALTPEISDALYQNTCGIVDQLVGLYMHMQLAYLSVSPRPTVNAKFIEEICNKYYPGVRSLLNNITNPTTQKELQKVLLDANSKFDLTLEASRQVVRANEIMALTASQQDQILKRNVIKNIRSAEPGFSAETIASVFNKVAGAEDGGNLSEAKVTQAVLKILRSHNETKAKRKPTPKQPPKVSHDEMREALLK